MKRFHPTASLLFGAAALLSFSAPVLAQARGDERQRSHGHIPGGGLADRAQLAERLNQARWASDLQNLLREHRANPQFLRELQENPQRLRDIESMLKSLVDSHVGPTGRLNPDDPLLKHLQGVVREWSGTRGTPPPGIDDTLWKRLGEAVKPERSAPRDERMRAPGTPPSENGGRRAAPGRPPAASPSPASPRSDGGNPFAPESANGFNDRLMRWAHRLVERNPSLRDSSTVRRVIDEIDQLRMRDGLRLDENSAAMESARSIEKHLPSQQFIDERIRPLIGRLPRTGLPDIRLPSIDLPRLPSIDLPMTSLPTPTGSEIGIGMLALFVVVGLGLIATKLLRNRQVRLTQLGFDGVSGHAPPPRLNPNAPIRSRAELIRAFETLSVQELGLEARNWNHRAIAARLGGDDSDRQRVAERLATLYETARYTPDTDALAPDWFHSAQREILLLVGSTPA